MTPEWLEWLSQVSMRQLEQSKQTRRELLLRHIYHGTSEEELQQELLAISAEIVRRRING